MGRSTDKDLLMCDNQVSLTVASLLHYTNTSSIQKRPLGIFPMDVSFIRNHRRTHGNQYLEKYLSSFLFS